jgi:hypothetical protein
VIRRLLNLFHSLTGFRFLRGKRVEREFIDN